MTLTRLPWFLISIPARLKGMVFNSGSRIGPGYDWKQVNLSNITLMENAQVGRRAWLQTLSKERGRIVVGQRSSIGRDCVISSACGISIGSDCVISYRVSIIDHEHLFRIGQPPHPFEVADEAPITIGPRTFIGSNCSILKGVNIGADCIVGASSVVTQDVPDFSIVAGNPARVLKLRSYSA